MKAKQLLRCVRVKRDVSEILDFEMLPLVHTEYKNYLRGTPKRSLSLKHIHNIEVFFLSVRTKKGPQKRDMCLRSQISSLSPSNLRSVFVVVFVICLLWPSSYRSFPRREEDARVL